MPLRAIELFAGVGGFRLGLQAAGIEVVWANQWEPGRKTQHAFQCYVRQFGESPTHVNEDIAKVDLKTIPPHELLTGGFPCQDYSVATTKAAGIQGKKGVLWWEIHRILEARRPGFFILENVDRLLKSPSRQRGRDFGVMLHCLADLGYRLEWRVLNAADYGAAQKRRRVFLVGAHSSTTLGKSMKAAHKREWLLENGLFTNAFPIVSEAVRTTGSDELSFEVLSDLQSTSDRFEAQFHAAGIMVDGKVWTLPVKAKAEPLVVLKSILEENVDAEYFVPDAQVAQWKYLKGSKSEERVATTGFKYRYAEGAIPFPDSIERPGRTLLTSEGGTAPSRFKHLVEDPRAKRLRVLTPLECERMNQFPDNWTQSLPENWRYFCMGNALVVGLVERIAKELTRRTSAELAVPEPRKALARSHFKRG